MAAQSRTLRNSVISLAIFFALVAALLLAVPGLRCGGASGSRTRTPRGSLAGVGLELLSCLGYVVLFELVFGMPRPQPELAAVAVGAGGQLGRVGQRPGGHRAGRVGAAHARASRWSGSQSARC